MTARRRRGRRGSGLSTIYWRDIPAQVTASANGEKHKTLLPARFQHAIDRAAGVAGLTDTDSYVAEWRSVDAELDGATDASAQAEAEAERLDQTYDRDRLETLVAQGGLDSPSPEQDQP